MSTEERLERLGLDYFLREERRKGLQRRIAAHSKKVDEFEAKRKGDKNLA